MATQMKAFIVPKVKASWELNDRPVPEPGPERKFRRWMPM